jgi:hypothetical protein
VFWLTFFVNDTQDSFTILNVYLYFIFFSIVVSISMLAICYAPGLTPHSLAMRAPTVAMELAARRLQSRQVNQQFYSS